MDAVTVLPMKGVIFEPTALIIPDGISFDDWAALGKSLQAMRRSVHWWIGDWIRFGERKWGEQYAQALDETPFAYQTLANDVWVASAIEPSHRKENLSFAHHAAVAALPPPEQDEWLGKAEREGWSSRKLWEEARARRQLRTLYDGEGQVFHFKKWDKWIVRLPRGIELQVVEGQAVNVIMRER